MLQNCSIIVLKSFYFCCMTKREALKNKKMCVVCGEEFLGTSGKITCSGRCRSILARLKKANKRPEYILMAKGKGQKIPDLNAPKRLKFKRGETKQKPKIEIPEEKINFVTPTAESYDGSKLNHVIADEARQYEVPKKELTHFEKLAHNDKIDREIKDLERLTMPVGMLPKQWGLKKSMMADDLKEKKYKI